MYIFLSNCFLNNLREEREDIVIILSCISTNNASILEENLIGIMKSEE